MKPIEIKDQPRLGVRRTVSLTLTGIRYRLFRSSVTVGVAAVATAFLMNVLSESLIRGSILSQTAARAARLHQASIWDTRLSDPGTPDSILAELAAATPGTVDEAVGMAKWPSADPSFLESRGRLAAEYLRFFATLEYDARRQLFHEKQGIAILDDLLAPGAWEDFCAKLKEMRSLRLPHGLGAFRVLLDEWPRLRDGLERIRAARAAAIARVQEALRGQPVMEALVEADGAFGAVIRSAGFRFPDDTARLVAEQARQARDRQRLEAALLRPAVRQAAAGRLDLSLGEVNPPVLWKLLESRQGAEWYLGVLQEAGVPASDLTVSRLTSLAPIEREDAELARLRPLAADTGAGTGIQERMLWLVLVSMVVCAAGIANAMLMSVTERFREIATLKCLGALDGTIMGMCVIEATLLGVTGGVIGAVAGMLLGVARLAAAYGAVTFRMLPLGSLLLAMAASVVVGTGLAALAALYPSFRAARLVPMEAMRVE